jgi:hypothetical protein
MIIGLSLLMCIRDMANGEVDPEDVQCIIVGFHCPTINEYYTTVKRYIPTYWEDNPRAEQLAVEFWDTGKIKYLANHQYLNIAQGAWAVQSHDPRKEKED